MAAQSIAPSCSLIQSFTSLVTPHLGHGPFSGPAHRAARSVDGGVRFRVDSNPPGGGAAGPAGGMKRLRSAAASPTLTGRMSPQLHIWLVKRSAPTGAVVSRCPQGTERYFDARNSV